MKTIFGFFSLAFVALTLAEKHKGCLKNDIVFLMDSSGSQSPVEFQDQINFVQNVVEWFQIGPDNVLVSVISYSLDVIEEFPLNQYTNKEDLISAIGKVTYQGLLTNTSGALRYTRLNSFLPENGARPDVDRLVVVLTDGVSDDQNETVLEAELLRQMDRVKVYAVAIGQETSPSELLSITGDEFQIQKAPNSDFLGDILPLFRTTMCRIDGGWGNWSDWSSCSKTCGNGTRIRKRECDSPEPKYGGGICEGPSAERIDCYLKKCYECGDYPIDIFIFLVASISTYPWNFRKEKAFIHQFINNTKIGEDALRVGLAVYSTSVYEEFNLNTYYNKTAMMKHIDGMKYNWGLTHTWNALDYARTKAFLPENGGRPNATQVLVVFERGGSNSEDKTTKAADLLNLNSHIQVFVVGIGSSVDQQELHTIASKRENIIISEKGFDGLKNIEKTFRQTICPEK